MRNDELKASTCLTFIISRSSFLINLRQHFAADVLAARALARHQAARGRDDVDAVAAQHLRNFGRAHVNAPARSRDAREVRDRTRTARIVAKKDAYRSPDALALRDQIVDVALFL